MIGIETAPATTDAIAARAEKGCLVISLVTPCVFHNNRCNAFQADLRVLRLLLSLLRDLPGCVLIPAGAGGRHRVHEYRFWLCGPRPASVSHKCRPQIVKDNESGLP
jgi:hypothetical protein